MVVTVLVSETKYLSSQMSTERQRANTDFYRENVSITWHVPTRSVCESQLYLKMMESKQKKGNKSSRSICTSAPFFAVLENAE